MTSIWRIGDFGRFRLENRKYPRFEVIASDKAKNSVAVWYSGEYRPRVINRDTILRDCENFWDVEIIPQESVPEWVSVGNHFLLSAQLRSLNLTLTEIQQDVKRRMRGEYPDYTTKSHVIDVNNRKFTIRRRRGDYVSCMSLDSPKQLLLIPLQMVISHGQLYKEPLTIWDMIGNRDILDPDEPEF